MTVGEERDLSNWLLTARVVRWVPIDKTRAEEVKWEWTP